MGENRRSWKKISNIAWRNFQNLVILLAFLTLVRMYVVSSGLQPKYAPLDDVETTAPLLDGVETTVPLLVDGKCQRAVTKAVLTTLESIVCEDSLAESIAR